MADPEPGPADVTITSTPDTVQYDDSALAAQESTTIEGTLQIAYIDRIDGFGRPRAETTYAVLTDEGDTVPIDVAEDLPLAAANGDIEAQVVDAGSDSPQLAEATVQTPPTAATPTGVAHRAYVVLVPRTGTLPSQAAVAARLSSAVLDEWVDEADGAMSGFTVAGTATLAATAPSGPTKTDLCQMSGYGDLWDAGAAKFPGVSFASGSANHLVMLVSGEGCGKLNDGTLGIGTVGAGINSGGSSTLLWDTNYVDATGVHELGHNFSLGHANVEGAEYYDLYSVMGFGYPGGAAPALDSLFRDRLGLEGSDELASPESGSDTTYELEARGLESGLRGISVTDPADGSTYWLDYRAGVGRDIGSAYVAGKLFGDEGLRYAPGLVIYRRAADYATSGDIDVVKREAGIVDGTSWTGGDTFTSAAGGVSVSVLGADADSASVRVMVQQTFTTIDVPVVTGTPQVGQALTASEGSFTPAPDSHTYEWLRSGRSIAGAVASTYTATASDRGARLSVRVTASRAGYAPQKSTSAPSGPVDYGTFSTTTPQISGTAKVGRTLKGVVGEWSPLPTSYRWQYYSKGSWRDVSGATKTSYKVSSKYTGKKLRFRVKGDRSGYAKIYRYSSSTSTIKR